MHNKLIVGLSGKKQSGKDTIARYLVDSFASKESVGPTIKLYSFADILKKNICMDILGLTWEQCKGTDEQKNSLTSYKWSDFSFDMRKGHTIGMNINGVKRDVLISGFMTSRQVMQFVGTDIFRKYFGENVWVDATLKKIRKEEVSICIITDARFSSEVNSILSEGGIVIRLDRNVFPDDSHSSETSLDSYDFYSTKDCYLVNNGVMDIEAQNKRCLDIIKNKLYKTEE